MKKENGLFRLLLTMVVMSCVLASACLTHAWDLKSFPVANDTGKTGRAYFSVMDQYGNPVAGRAGFGGYSSAALTPAIRGVPTGTFTVKAFIDTQGTGFQHANDPVFSGPLTVSGNRDFPVTFSNPPTTAAVAPGQPTVLALDGAAFVMIDPPRTANDVPIADKFDLYWSTDPAPGPGNISAGSGKALGIIGKMPQMIYGLTNNVPLYFAVNALAGATNALSPVSDPVTINPPAPGASTVNVTVDTTGIPKSSLTPLIVVLSDDNDKIYVNYVRNPVDLQTVAIQGVSAGTYKIYAILDLDGKGDIAALSNPSNLSEVDRNQRPVPILVDGVTAAVTGPTLKLALKKAGVSVGTAHSNQNGGEGYSLRFAAVEMNRQLASVTLEGGPQVTGPIDLATGNHNDKTGAFELQLPVNGRPAVGAQYNFTLTYADGARETETRTAAVTKVLDLFPGGTFPSGTTGPDSFSPALFGWNNPGNLTGFLTTSVNFNGFNAEFLPMSALSASNQDGASASGQFNSWYRTVQDLDGNQTQSSIGFTPSATGPTITSISPESGPAGTPVTITGTGFSSTTGNNTVMFSGTPATVTAASANSLTVNAPASSGVVTVNVGGVTAGSSVPFAAITSYTVPLTDGADGTTPLTAATCKVVDTGFSTTTNSTTPGTYTLQVPARPYFSLAFTQTGYYPTYSAVMNVTASSTGSFSMYSVTDITGRGITLSAGKGLMAARIQDGTANANTNVPGAVVTATSLLHPDTPYTVRYTNGTSAADPTATSTASDGRYYVLDVDEGDFVTVTATKAGMAFQSRLFNTHAGAVSTGSIKGAFALASPPTASPAGGAFGGSTSVTLSSTDAANYNIFYTANGSDPGLFGLQYSGPITIASNTNLKFVTKNKYVGQAVGSVQTAIFTIGAGISGQVTAVGSGAPVQNINVQLYDENGSFLSSINTDNSGNYVLPVSQTGNYKVCFSSNGTGYIGQCYDNQSLTPSSATSIVVASATQLVTGINASLSQAPSVPTGLTAKPAGASQIDVSWNVSSGNFAVAYYRVYRNYTDPSDQAGNSWSDTSLTPGTYTYTVSACDAADNCSAQSPPVQATLPVTVSGTVGYAGAKSGRIYLTVQTNIGTLGTSISAPGAYTIRGVPPGSYTVNAFMDALNTGAQVQSSPAGSANVSGTGSVISGDITLVDAPVSAPGQPMAVGASPGDSSVLIGWDGAKTDGVEAADSYTVYWDTSAAVGKITNVGSKTVPAGLDSPVVIEGLANGSAYYFAVVPTSAGVDGPPSAVYGPVTVGAPSGGNTVSGTVTYTGPAATGPLYVAIVQPDSKGIGGVYYTKISSPSSSQSFSVSGVPNGTYAVFGLYDMNNDQSFGYGDVTETDDAAPVVTLTGSGASGVAVPLASVAAKVAIATDHAQQAGSSNQWYSVNGKVDGQMKRPVAVVLTGVPASSGMSAPVDIALGHREINFWSNVANRPALTDTYNFTVEYSDGTTEPFSPQVTGVLDSFPTNPAISGATVSTVPTFTWGTPAAAPAFYKYRIWAGDNNGNSWNPPSLPSSQLSAVYGFDGDAPPLQVATQYNWNVSLNDRNGNSATVQSSFTPTVAGAQTTIAGAITNANGAGIPYSFVTVYDASSNQQLNSVSADATGHYSVSGVPPGSYKLKFSASGYFSQFYNNKTSLPAADPVTVVAGTVTPPANATLIIDGGKVQAATGSYTYTSGAGPGPLSIVVANSNFICGGPTFPAETDTITSIGTTTMIWQTGPDETMTWTRSSGSAGDITGTWNSTDQGTGALYTLVFNADNTMSVAGNGIQCDSNGQPSIVSFGPASAFAGSLVTINGGNFSPLTTDNLVLFNGVAAVVKGVRPGQLYVAVPAGATTGKISVSNSGGTSTSISDFTMLAGAPAVAFTWAGVHHRTGSDGAEFDALDAGLNIHTTSLAGMTLTVSGPNSFTHSFTDADLSPSVNGQLALYKKYPTPATPLAPGLYTFTLDDGQGHTLSRTDTHVTVSGPLPRVDSSTAQLQRNADGSYRISWASVNDAQAYYYRLRISRNDAASTAVYDSARALASFADVPAKVLFNGSMYRLRVETGDSMNGDLATNRSDSAWKLFSPSQDDYNPSLAPQTISFNTLPAKSYGDADLNPGATASSGLAVSYASSNTAVATIVAGKIHIVGSGTTSITASQAGDGSWLAAASIQQPLTVAKATLTVKADGKAKVFNTANPLLTWTPSGFVNGDGAAALSGAPALSTTAVTASPVGNYPINIAAGTLAALNYNLNLVPDTLAVSIATPTIAWPAPAAVFVGSSLTASQLNASTSVSGSFSYNPPLGTLLNSAGPQTLSATFTPTDGVNYQSATASVSLTVNKASATALLSGLNPTYDGSAKTVTATTTPPGLAYSVTYDGVTTAPSAAGSYTVVATINDANYTGSATGNLTIAKATPTVTWPTPTSVFVGSSLTATQLDASASVAGSVSYTPALGTVLNTAGPQILSATFTPTDGTNYTTATASVTLTVNKASATAVLSGLNPTYDGSAKTVTATTTPPGLAYSVTYNGVSAAPSAAGSYPVVATINDANYTGSATGTLAIAKADQATAVTTAAPASAAYNSQFTVAASAPGGAVTYSSGSTGVCTNNGATFTMIAASGVCVVQYDQAGSSNYNPSHLTSSTTAVKASQSIGAIGFAPATLSFGGTTTVDAAASSGLGVSFISTTSPVCTVSGTTVTAVTAGVCSIAANQAGDGNYAPASQVTRDITVNAVAPGAPTFGAGAASAGNTQATVSFSAPATNGGGTITGYSVTSNPAGGVDINAGKTALVHTIIGLSNGTAYTFTVTASNVAGPGAASAPSNSVTPRTEPDPPTAVSATSGSAGATVSFLAPASDGGSAITSYTVTSSPGNVSVVGTSSPIAVTGLSNGTAYTFTVTASNAKGSSVASKPSAPVTPITVPGAPGAVSATGNNASATVTFSAPASNGGSPIIGYTVTSSPGNFSASSAAGPITVTGLANGTPYTFTVTANSAFGPSLPSAASGPVTPSANVPGAPIMGSASGGNADATVSFTPPASDGGSTITGYTVTSNPGNFSASGPASPITVASLANGTAYTFTVTASTSAGTSVPSAASNAVIPATLPDAPRSVTTTGGNASATVNFLPPATNGGSPITGYTVTSSPGSLTRTGTASPIVFTGLSNGTGYSFTVTATNAKGTGAASAASNTVTPDVVPGAPSAVSAQGGNASAIVSFTLPAANGGSTVTGYTVTSSPGNIAVPGTNSPITVTGLTNGQAYTFSVTAANASRTSVPSAASNSVTPATVPGAPVGVSAVGGNAGAIVNFTAPAANGGSPITVYTVTSSPGNISNSGTGSPIIIAGLTNDTVYTFTVTAGNAKGASVASSASNAVTPLANVPGAPTVSIATGGNASATVSFTAPTDNGGSPITGYTVTSSPGGISAGGPASPITVTGLSNGTSYRFMVTATNAAGAGTASGASNAVVPDLVPGAPAITGVSVDYARATVSFSAPAGNGGTQITSYLVTSSPGNIRASGAGSPISVTGLTNGTPYSFTVQAVNAKGAGDASAASGTFTPSDTTAPVVFMFGIPAALEAPDTASSVTVPVNFFMAFDNVGVTGYLVTATPVKPAPGQAGWSTDRPASYGISATPGIYALYGWVKDAAGNVSDANNYSGAQVVVIPVDTTPPVIISGPTVTSIRDTFAVIEWQTNEAASGGLKYGESFPLSNPVAETGYTIGHSRTISGLTPGTTYYVGVSATDLSGNGPSLSREVSFRTSPAPDTTAPLVTEGPTVIGIGQDTATVQWRTNEPALGSVFYGTDDTLGLSAAEAEFSTTHSVKLTGLAAESLHYLKVSASDTVGNGPRESAMVSFKTAAVPDTTAPAVVEGPMVVNISDTGATVIWKTDEPSTSEVTTNIGGASYALVADSSLTTSHTVNLTGLQAATPYSYRIASSDGSGNTRRIPEITASEKTFITLDAPDTTPPVILEGPMVVNITEKSAVILWGSDEPADSIVEYGTSDTFVTAESRTVLTRTHYLPLTALEPGTLYYYRATSTDSFGNGPTASKVGSFTTNAYPVYKQPVITKAPSVIYKTQTSMTLYWETDDLSNSVVEYGENDTLTNRVSNSEMVTSHQITITNLKSNTAYKVVVSSTNSSGNTIVADSGKRVSYVAFNLTGILSDALVNAVPEFSTASLDDNAAPVVSAGPAVAGITDTQAVISWTTDEIADSQVNYGLKGGALSLSAGSIGQKTEHVIVLTNLTPGTEYDFQVSSTDPSNNGPTTVAGASFTTAATPDTTAPVITGLLNTVVIGDKYSFEWTTDEPATTQLRYGLSAAAMDSQAATTGLGQAHALTLTLQPGTTYYVAAVAMDSSGNVAESAPVTFKSAGNLDVTEPTTTPSVGSGTYTGSQNVTLSADKPASIYYTTDGSSPTSASAQYNGPIKVASSKKIGFFAIDGSGNKEVAKSVNLTIQYQISMLTPDGNGTISCGSPGNPATVDSGATAVCTTAPNTGYEVASISGCGGSFTGAGYTTGAITADCSVSASFRLLALSVTPAVSGSGSIAPATVQTVSYGSSQDFTVTPAAGYQIDSVTGCGGTLNGAIYSTGAISGACSVTASFSPITFSVTPGVSGNGALSPASAQTVNSGASTSFQVTPAAGYQVASVTGCGGTLSGTTFTTGAISGACSVTASFTPITFSVTPAVSGNGALSPASAQTVNSGASTSFSVTPAAGFQIASVTGCGGTLSGTTFTTGAISGACNVTASFSPITFSVTPAVSGNGALSPASAQTVNSGATTSFSVAPAAGFQIASVTGCGGTLSGTTYTIAAASANCTVTASFAVIPVPVVIIGDLNGDGKVDIVDALRALRISVHIVTPSAEELARDVGPMIQGVLKPDGAIDIGDALLILKKAVGALNW